MSRLDRYKRGVQRTVLMWAQRVEAQKAVLDNITYTNEFDSIRKDRQKQGHNKL